MEVRVSSIPMTEEEKARWPRPDETCPVCQKPFGTGKMRRLSNGTVVHKACWSRLLDQDFSSKDPARR